LQFGFVVLESIIASDGNIPGKQAKALSTDDIGGRLFHSDHSCLHLRNHLIVLLSIKGDLRVDEIAKLTRDTVLNASCELSWAYDHRRRRPDEKLFGGFRPVDSSSRSCNRDKRDDSPNTKKLSE
jgi:hypothetical protein